MVDLLRVTIRHSVEDVIRILENEPVRGDMVPQITAVQVMNRTSIAHLSIERALKFLITTAGGPLIENHDLGDQYNELVRHDPMSAKHLEEAFQAAVRHYRYNPNSSGMTHLKTVARYLGLAASNRAFQDIRYWELTQSLNEILLRRIYLSLHIELLQALSEILLAPNRPIRTVAERVERAVESAMWHTIDFDYKPVTAMEASLHSYVAWRNEFASWSEAMAFAVQERFQIGEEFIANLARKAYATLLNDKDPAVSYYFNTLNILPRQPREMIPHVEWLGPVKERTGSVKTPAGQVLGFIERGPDALWYITPLQEGIVRVSAKARSQTDARSYLGVLLTMPARVIVRGESRSLRVVGEEHSHYQRSYGQPGNEETWTHKVTFWDENHGIEANDRVRIEVPSRGESRVVEIFEGTVTKVAGPEAYLSGYEVFDIEKQDRD